MTEGQIVEWFAVHPFTRTVAVAIVGAVAAAIRADRASLEAHRQTAGNADATFDYFVALRNYAKAAAMAGGAVIGAEILHVLGAA